jgi:selenide,water dikinase
LQKIFKPDDYPDLLVGLGEPDDAAVYRIDDTRVVVATLDFFTPVVDNPYHYGAIAAANALSDLYAMGVDPVFALNISAMPGSLDTAIVSEIMRGGAEKVREAGAVVAGGHSIQDDEPKYGLVAFGFGEAEKLIKKTGALPGSFLIITKPLGTGVTTTALRTDEADEEDIRDVIHLMLQLNREASHVAREVGVRSGTDVSGFSLLGHAVELSEASQVQLNLYLERVPFLRGARKYAEMWKFPGGSFDNKLFFQDRTHFEDGIDETTQMMLFDAQTSGGLLLVVERDQITGFKQRAEQVGQDYWVIGEVLEGNGIHVSRKVIADFPESSDDRSLWFYRESV